MKKVLRLAGAALFVFVLAIPVKADSFTLDGGTAGSIPGGATNEFITGGLFGGGSMVGGYYGSQILFDVPEETTLTIDFFGAEADFINEFYYDGASIFTHPGGLIIAPNLGSPLDTFSTTIGGSGTLDFSFVYNSGAGSVDNGSNPDDSGGGSDQNFFATCNPFSGDAGSGGTTCDTVYLFLDDGGAGPDDNHDDFLVRLHVTVPEPGSIFLLSSGLLALGLARRRSSGRRA